MKKRFHAWVTKSEIYFFVLGYHRERRSKSPSWTSRYRGNRSYCSDSDVSILSLVSAEVRERDESLDRQRSSREDLRLNTDQGLKIVDQPVIPLEVSNTVDNQIDHGDISVLPGPTENSQEELSGEILQMMGQRIAPVRIPAQPIHKDLVVRIEEIIKNGLPVEERKQLLLKFPPPSNCLIIDPPKLNLEVKACLQDTVLNRDSRIVQKQERIAAGIAGLTSLMSILLKLKIEEKLPMVDKLSSIIRILTDLQHEESAIRRSLVMKNINVSMRESLALALPDEWLFGNNLEEKIKRQRCWNSTVKKLKPSKPHQLISENSKNWKGPLRRQRLSQNKYRQNYRTWGGRKTVLPLEHRQRVPRRKPTQQRRQE